MDDFAVRFNTKWGCLLMNHETTRDQLIASGVPEASATELVAFRDTLMAKAAARRAATPTPEAR
jgi:hypothetical protein